MMVHEQRGMEKQAGGGGKGILYHVRLYGGTEEQKIVARTSVILSQCWQAWVWSEGFRE